MSLISLSRRELLARTIATGVGGIIVSSLGRLPASAQSLEDVQGIQDGMRKWSQIASQRPLVKDWLDHSELEKATKNDFVDTFHAEWANDYAMFHKVTRSLFVQSSTIFGESNPFWMGIKFHPWQHPYGYHSNRTLNVVEQASQYENRTFFEQTLSFYSGGQMVFAPFPDTPRLPITPRFQDSFATICQKANLNSDNYNLHFARFHVMAGRVGGQVVPRPVLAHAYTFKTAVNIKQELRMTYTSLV